MKILEIKNLTIGFNDKKAVDDLSFDLYEGEIVALVGESGCGKSLTAYSILSIFPPGSYHSGMINYKGIDLLSLDEEQIRQIRGNNISLIPQDPQSAFNPVFTVGDQIREVLEVHKGVSCRDSNDLVINALQAVNIPSPKQRINDYPHQFSGGMMQRALIAMALVTSPNIVIADEPTTALDVTIQIQILELMKQLKKKGQSILLITHDLAQVQEVCDRIFVMYLGKIVEFGTVKEIFSNPKHPYTIGLLNSLPDENKKTLTPILGQVPSIFSIPTGCTFHPRCPFIFNRCKVDIPDLYDVKETTNHKSRCFLETI